MDKAKIIIVDENDEIIGYKSRGTLNKEDIYRVSGLWIINSKGEVLLAQRKFTKKHDPGKWGPAVAGTNDQEETYESNIIKEAEEEIGLKEYNFKKADKVRRNEEHNFFCQWFTAIIDKDIEDFKIQEDEVEQIKWYSKKEFLKEYEKNPDQFLKGIKERFDKYN